ncbi:hypothetical protein BJ165DRAFT_457336 [Panaeolus papilionaceus]|nr:hypothetical protein BJ165DRAFT_457336 [Panaeolus papilionaceus]
MNRHHPYNASFEHSPARRGNNSPGPGEPRHRYSDRGGAPFRGRGGGYNRGRGGYSNYDSGASYDQGHSQNDISGYHNYEQPPTNQHPYYQDHSYSSSTPAHFPPPPQSSSGYQAYNKYEDGPGNNYEDDDNRNNRRPFRKDRDDKVHDSIIEERIQRERPCRTLFIRNIKYETPSEEVRRIFEEHGEIKTFFDLISTRGMVFVTYFDLRAAERARDRLQGSEISGRPIDVHYSLPRDDQKGNDREKSQQLQGSLQVTLRNSPSGQPIDDNEVRRKFQQFGDVKSIKPVADRIDSRYVEYYDTRACTEAHERLRHQGLQDGIMDIVFAWDVNENPNGPGGHHRDGHRDWEDRGGRGRGGRGRGRGRGRGFDDYDDRRGGGDYGRERDYRGGGGGRGRYDDDYSGGRGGRNGGYNDRHQNQPPPQWGPPGEYPPPPMHYGGPPPPPAGPEPIPGNDDRLEQARKVQQLLAALKQPAAPSAPTPPLQPPVPPQPSMPPMPMMQHPGGYPGYPPAPSYPGIPPPAGYPPAPPAHQQMAPPAPGAPGSNPLSGLPPNVMALLQAAQGTRPPGM